MAGRLFSLLERSACAASIAPALLSLMLMLMAGCGGGSSSTNGGSGGGPPVNPGSGTAFQGTVNHGTQAVSGASVQLYAAGASGLGSAASALLSTPVSTDANGKFNIPTSYACPSSSSLLYLVANGGNPGLTAGTSNSALTMMTAVGPCGSLASGESFEINELTTVGSVAALAQFMSVGAGANLGASSSNAQGLGNAFAKVANLVNTATGAVPGPGLPAGATAPVAELNTLADILSGCVGSSGTGGECSNLFAAATPSGAMPPTNTLDAALLIAQNPANNVSAIFGLLPGTPPFQPPLTSAPGDWTIAISYSGGGIHQPSSLAIDADGNVWVADYDTSAVSELSPQGAALSPVGGFSGGGLFESYGLTIDNGGNVWVTDQESASVNHGQGALTELNSSGTVLSGTDGFFAGGIDFPLAAASDTAGNIWVANWGAGTATLLSNTGAPLSGTAGFGSGQLAFPVALAVDADQNAWFANSSGTTVTRISLDGSQISQSTVGSGPDGVAIDAHGNVWVANYYDNSISELSSSGSVIAAGYTGGGLYRPKGMAIDGQGNVWAVNHLATTISVLQGADSSAPGTAISPAGGLGASAGLSLPFGIAIDSSGSVWVSSFNNNLVVEFVGAASPVKTPLLGPAAQP